jgi:hypothetical protein
MAPRVLGHHPLRATRPETGEVLHVRFAVDAAGSSHGAQRFVRELVGRRRRCGAIEAPTGRADAGFHSGTVMDACWDHGVASSITPPQNPSVRSAIEAIDEGAWRPIDDTANGEAWAGEVDDRGHRLIVRRTKPSDTQPALFPTFRYTPLSPVAAATPSSSTPTTIATPSSSSQPGT